MSKWHNPVSSLVYLGNVTPKPDLPLRVSYSTNCVTSVRRLRSQKVLTASQHPQKAEMGRPSISVLSVGATKLSHESCASMLISTYTMGLSPTSVNTLVAVKHSVRSRISESIWGFMLMRGPSSAHKGVERASGPKATCEIMNDATLEISKCLNLFFVFSFEKGDASFSTIFCWLSYIKNQIIVLNPSVHLCRSSGINAMIIVCQRS